MRFTYKGRTMDTIAGLIFCGIVFYGLYKYFKKHKAVKANIGQASKQLAHTNIEWQPPATHKEMNEYYPIKVDRLSAPQIDKFYPPTRKHAKPEIDRFLDVKSKTRIIIFDVETNGLSGFYSVLSCSAIKYDFGPNTYEMTEIDRFNRYYYPVEQFDTQAIDVNGLTREVITAKRGDSVYPDHFCMDSAFETFCSDTERFVAHNISFDMQFIPLMEEKKKFCTMMTNTDIVCVYFMAQKNEWKWPKLSETAIHYGIPFNENDLHNSMCDTEITAKIFLKMIEAMNRDDNEIELSQGVITANINQEDSDFQRFLKTDGFIFSVDGPRIQEDTHVGISVKLWIPKVKNPDKVYIYHRDGPGGCIGIVPETQSDAIADHLLDAMEYDARIVERTYNTCKIKCRLISREETELKKEEKKASLKKELTKPYNPQKPIMLMIAIKKKNVVKVGDKLIIEIEDLDSYGPYPCPWHIKFLNQAGDIVAIFADDRSTIQRVLKAHFNSYLFDIEVLEIAKERSSAWKGYPTQLVIKPFKVK